MLHNARKRLQNARNAARIRESAILTVMPTTLKLCVVRMKLAAIVTKVVRELYVANYDLKMVRALKQDDTKFVLQLAEARKAERRAIAAFDKHRKEHGC